MKTVLLAHIALLLVVWTVLVAGYRRPVVCVHNAMILKVNTQRQPVINFVRIVRRDGHLMVVSVPIAPQVNLKSSSNVKIVQ